MLHIHKEMKQEPEVCVTNWTNDEPLSAQIHFFCQDFITFIFLFLVFASDLAMNVT